MQYYRSKVSGKYFTENFLNLFDPRNDISEDASPHKVLVDVMEPVESPSVIDCLRGNSWNVAVLRYRELHPDCSWDEACKAVTEIKKDFNRLNHKRK